MKDRMLIIPGGFVPYNDTVTLLNYKRLRELDLEMDVFALRAKEDEGLAQELKNDECFSHFHISYSYELESVVPRNHPLRLPISFFYMKRYIDDSLKAFEKKDYKYLFTSIVPGISHLCGKKIKKKHPDVIWYASFSDPFKNSPYKKADLKGKSLLYKFIYQVGAFFLYNNAYEEAAVRYADKLIFICEEQRDYTLAQYPDLNHEELMAKSIIMPLTYIPEWKMYQDILKAPEVHNEVRQCVHLGRLYGLRKIDSFLLALKELNEEIKHLEDRIVFHQYSEIQDHDLRKIREYGLDKLFVVHDKVSYDRSIEIMKEADVLLLFDTLMPNDKVQPYLPSKIVEYLLYQKPIIGICDANSPSYRILKEYGYQTIGSEKEKIKENIRLILEDKSSYRHDLSKLNAHNYNMLEL